MEPQHVPYNMWGPPVCRWFAAEAFPTRWITITAGQRCAIIPDIGVETYNSPIIMLNFNQNDVLKVLDREKRDKEEKVAAEREAKNIEASRAQHPSIVQGPNMGGATRSSEDSSIQTEQEIDSGKGTEHSGDENTEYQDVETFSDTSDEVPAGDFDEASQDRIQPSPPRAKAIIQAGDAVDDSQHCFENMVYSSLPYTVSSSLNNYRFHGVLLDEERILGLQVHLFLFQFL